MNFRRKKSLPVPGDGVLLSRGRDALIIISEELKEKSPYPKVLMPAFICDIVPKTILQQGVGVDFYDITENLEIDLASVERSMSDETSSILYVNYFGFLQPRQKIRALSDYGLPLIEDNTHGFLSGSVIFETENVQGWTFSSYRKLLPVPDGALLVSVGKGPHDIDKLRYPAFKYVSARLFGLLLKRLALKFPFRYLESARQEFFTLSVRCIDYPGPSSIAGISELLLKFVDIEQANEKRRRNYAFLAEAIRESKKSRKIFDCLPNDVCPFGLPLIAQNRVILQDRLLQNNTSSAVLWERNNMVPASDYPGAMNMSDHILVLPVGQAYSEEDMMRIAQTIKEIS